MVLVLLSAISARAGVKNIEQTRPRMGQQGTTVDVTISGVAIDNPREILFFKPGIRAFDFRKPDEQPPRRGFAHGGYLDSAITCKFEIAADCPPGEYAFRLLTDTQLSHVGTFHVTPFHVVPETPASKDSADKAQVVPNNVTINGVLGHDLADFYRVAVRVGQQISVELDSVRISDQNYGQSEFDLAVRVLDDSGRELATNDDNSIHVQDPVLSTMIDNDGYVFVVVERSVSQVTQTTYALHIGSNRRPLVAYPPGGQAGTNQTFQMLGDASGGFEVTLGIPATPGDFGFFGGAPSPVKLRASAHPNWLEGETNRAYDATTELGVALNGIIESFDDIDEFKINVRQGEPLHVRVFSAALGSPIDPVLRIRDQDGNVEIEADDARLTDRDVFGTSYRAGGGRPEILDPSIVWTPKISGEYSLEISDSSGKGGPTGVYRIEVEPPRTVVQTVLWSKTNDWTESTRVTGLAVPRGGRHTVNVSLPTGQWNALKSEFKLVAIGLPPGVRLVAPTVKPGVTFWPVQFIADADATPMGAIITLAAQPIDRDVQVENRSQENIPFLNHPGGDALKFVQTDRYVMGITDPVPFTLDVEQPTASLVRGGELAIPVKLTRSNGFTGAVEYSVRFVDRAVSFQPPTTIPSGETQSILRLSASAGAPLGQHPLAVVARSLEDERPRSMGAGDLRASSEIVEFAIAEAFVELASQPESIRRGERKSFVWTVKHKTPFAGQAQVRLLGLPKNVSVIGDPPVLTRGSKQIAFELEATGEALLGQVTGLGCEVMVTVGGQAVTQRTGSGSLRIDPARAESVEPVEPKEQP
jgi:hypothetical protein